MGFRPRLSSILPVFFFVLLGAFAATAAPRAKNNCPGSSLDHELAQKTAQAGHAAKRVLSEEWKAILQEYGRIWNETAAVNSKHYLANKTDKFVQFLARAGMRLSKTVSMPPLETMIDFIETEMRTLVAKGVITEAQTLRPAFVFEFPSGSLRVIPLGEEIPKGAFLSKQLLNDDLFLDAVARGYFPIGGTDRVFGGLGALAFEHDLAHFAAFLENPKYMAALRETADELRFRGVRLGTHSSKGTPTGFTNRLFHVVEGMSVVPSSNQGKLLKILKLPPKADPAKVYTVKEVYKHLKKLSQPELIELLQNIRNESEPLMQHLGGTYKDLLTTLVFRDPTTIPSFHPMDETLRSIYQSLVHLQEFGITDKDALLRQIARFEVAAYESTKVPPETWVRDALLPGQFQSVDKNSALYKYICLTGIWGSGASPVKAQHEIFLSHCQEKSWP